MKCHIFSVLIGFLVACGFLTSAEAAVKTDEFGLGIQIGDPTGISVRLGKTSANSIRGAVAWSSDLDFHLQGDYLWNKNNLFEVEGEKFHGYFGVGGRLQSRDRGHSRRDHDEDALAMGGRFPGGLRWLNDSRRIEIFLDVAVAMDVVPETDADLDFGIGFHFYF